MLIVTYFCAVSLWLSLYFVNFFLVGVCSLPSLAAHLGEGNSMINPWVGEAHQPWLETHLGDGNCNLKPMARGTCWHFQLARSWQMNLLLFSE